MEWKMNSANCFRLSDHISKNEYRKNRKIDFSFVSEHCATFWTKTKIDSFWRGWCWSAYRYKRKRQYRIIETIFYYNGTISCMCQNILYIVFFNNTKLSEQYFIVESSNDKILFQYNNSVSFQLGTIQNYCNNATLRCPNPSVDTPLRHTTRLSFAFFNSACYWSK